MVQSNGVKMLRVVLVVLAVVAIIYGLGYLIIPGVTVALSGGYSIDFAWLRM